MSRLDNHDPSPPGPECVCGAELKQVPLPPDVAELAGQETIYVHVATGDTRCYPEARSPEDRAMTGEPLDA
jgi:hypothetical protein